MALREKSLKQIFFTTLPAFSFFLPFIWMLVFFIAPLLMLWIYSFLSRGIYGGIEWTWTLDNYLRVLDPLYLKIIFNSFWLSLETTFLALLLGLPFAITMTLVSKRLRLMLTILIVLPFLSNFLIRTFAIKSVLAPNGWFAMTLSFLNLVPDGSSLSTGALAVHMGMLTNYLPLMVLPLFVGMQKFDFSLIEAARDLGAGPATAFFKVFLPNIKTPILAGCMMVFIPCLGEFVIPDLLGGAKVQTLGKVVSEQFLKTRDWPFGAALTLILIYILLVCSFIENKGKRTK